MFFAYYPARHSMPDDEEIIKLQPQGSSRPSGKPSRLDETKKNHRLEKTNATASTTFTPQLKVINEETPFAEPEEEIEIEVEKKSRHHYEGKSVEYTIDEILHAETIDPDLLEKEWGSKRKSIPVGWITLLFLIVAGSIGYIVNMLANNHKNEIENVVTQQVIIEENETEIATAQTLVKSIDTTVKAYLAANTIDEKLRYVRHPEQMRARMEHYYASHPLTPLPCRVVTDYQPLTLENTLFWRVVAATGEKNGEAVLLEQISETNTLVDWESHVHYQPMPWEQFAQDKPTAAMSFRVVPEDSSRYLGEFRDEKRWMCYRLMEKSSEKILFGYVARNSKAHQRIDNRLAEGGKTMILRLQFAKAIKIPDSVVIDNVISTDTYRIAAPTNTRD